MSRLTPNGRRWLWAIILVVTDMALFWWIGHRVDPAQAATLWTSLDRAIPFVPWTVYLYSWVYTSMLYPVFVIRCPALFDRILRAYVFVLGLSLLFFAFFPVSSLELRPDVADLDPTVFHEWGVLLTFHVDPPTNLFPSQHLSVAALSMLCAWQGRRLWGLIALPVVVGVAVSILTMKQHFVADGVAGLVLAFAAWFLFIRGYDRDAQPREAVASSWRGPLAYFAFHALVYAAFFVAFLAGLQP